MTPEAFFLADENAARGQRFCVFHAPAALPPRAAVLHVHAFAEEMNKSRRMAALQARALAEAGCAVLQIDLLGCGDSSGSFDDTSWEEWVQDVLLGARWLQARYNAPLWLWGLRTGGLLAAAAAERLGTPCNLLLWAPVANGRTALQQFLRLKTAAEMLGGKARGVMDELRSRLAAGEVLDVAGYRIAPGLAQGMEQAILRPVASVQRMEWIELSTMPDGTPSPLASQSVAAWQASGCASRASLVQGPAFWQTTEIETAPALLPATISAILERSAP